MKSENYPPRLAVVAAIVHGDNAAPGPVISAARMGGTFGGSVALPAADSATTDELALAQALQGGENSEGAHGDPAMADLLYLADDSPEAENLATGLSQRFLLPDDSALGVPEEDRKSVFVELYRRLALHQLENQVRNKAAAALSGLSRSARRRR